MLRLLEARKEVIESELRLGADDGRPDTLPPTLKNLYSLEFMFEETRARPSEPILALLDQLSDTEQKHSWQRWRIKCPTFLRLINRCRSQNRPIRPRVCRKSPRRSSNCGTNLLG